ncbi:MAG: aminotransferase class V-fold PLP-dependent enzyme [FCB group bacterium]|nr:aminotransferase class V-fold PLP-dependent enzyme [FCB group bacterium]
MTELTRFRSEFPHTGKGILYLDHAAVSPMCDRVRRMVETYLRQAGGEKINNFKETLELLARVRGAFARMIQAPADRIAVVKNTTDGMILLARGLRWSPGDRIVLHRMEFPSNVYPWYDLRPFGVEIDFLDTPHGRVTPADLETKVRPETRLVAVSWVQYLDGYRNDLKSLAEWCHARGILLAVDAMQGLGALEMKVTETGIDFLAAGTAKWMLGPQGVGFVYLTEALQRRLHPPHLGWHSRQDFFDFHNYDQPLKPGADRFEFATPFSLGVWAVSGALELLLEAGQPAIERRVLALTDRLCDGLRQTGFRIISDRGAGVKSGILTFTHPEQDRNDRIFKGLTAAGVYVSTRNNFLRVSPHFYNTETEMDRFVETVARLM